MRKEAFLFRFSLAVAATAPLFFGAPARADFLDDLFGGSSEPAPYAQPARPKAAPVKPRAPRGSFSLSVTPPRARLQSRVAIAPGEEKDEKGEKKVAGSLPQKGRFCAGMAANAPADSADTRQHDATLRPGDSFVTRQGVLVYQGRAACPHGASDFVALAQARLPSEKRNALAALERAMRKPRAALSLVEEKPEQPQIVGQITPR